jgi:hypothetical protein
MSAPARVRQADVTRLIKAAQAAGIEVGAVRFSPDGEIMVYAKGAEQAPRANPLDDLLLGGN